MNLGDTEEYVSGRFSEHRVFEILEMPDDPVILVIQNTNSNQIWRGYL